VGLHLNKGRKIQKLKNY